MKSMAMGNPHILYTVESQTPSGVTIIRYICLHLLFPFRSDRLTYLFPEPSFYRKPVCAPSDMKGFASTNTGIFFPSSSETSALLALSGLCLLVPPRICTLPLLSLDIMFGFVFIVPELVLTTNAQYRCWTRCDDEVTRLVSSYLHCCPTGPLAVTCISVIIWRG
jgi:hypothetical protein